MRREHDGRQGDHRARHAGRRGPPGRVSVATASRVLDGEGRRAVGEDRRVRVLSAAAQLRYIPGAHAQAPAGGVASTVGMPRPALRRRPPDHRGGASAMAGALADLGHRSFAVVAGHPSPTTVRHRLDGFADGLAGHGVALAQDDVVVEQFSREGGYRSVLGLLERGLLLSRRLCAMAEDCGLAP